MSCHAPPGFTHGFALHPSGGRSRQPLPVRQVAPKRDAQNKQEARERQHVHERFFTLRYAVYRSAASASAQRQRERSVSVAGVCWAAVVAAWAQPRAAVAAARSGASNAAIGVRTAQQSGVGRATSSPHPRRAHPVRLQRCCLARGGACPSIPRVPLRRSVRARLANARRTRRAEAPGYCKCSCAPERTTAAAPRAHTPKLCTPATQGSGAAGAESEEPYDAHFTLYDARRARSCSRRRARQSSGDV